MENKEIVLRGQAAKDLQDLVNGLQYLAAETGMSVLALIDELKSMFIEEEPLSEVDPDDMYTVVTAAGNVLSLWAPEDKEAVAEMAEAVHCSLERGDNLKELAKQGWEFYHAKRGR